MPHTMHNLRFAIIGSSYRRSLMTSSERNNCEAGTHVRHKYSRLKPPFSPFGTKPLVPRSGWEFPTSDMVSTNEDDLRGLGYKETVSLYLSVAGLCLSLSGGGKIMSMGSK